MSHKDELHNVLGKTIKGFVILERTDYQVMKGLIAYYIVFTDGTSMEIYGENVANSGVRKEDIDEIEAQLKKPGDRAERRVSRYDRDTEKQSAKELGELWKQIMEKKVE